MRPSTFCERSYRYRANGHEIFPSKFDLENVLSGPPCLSQEKATADIHHLRGNQTVSKQNSAQNRAQVALIDPTIPHNEEKASLSRIKETRYHDEERILRAQHILHSTDVGLIASKEQPHRSSGNYQRNQPVLTDSNHNSSSNQQGCSYYFFKGNKVFMIP